MRFSVCASTSSADARSGTHPEHEAGSATRRIDESLRRAASSAAAWSSGAAREMALSFARSSGVEVDWDDGAGEEWLRVLDGSRVMALVSVKLPLAFIRGDASERIETFDDISLITVSDFDDPRLSCAPVILEEGFGATRRFESIDAGGFSANDLWYATV